MIAFLLFSSGTAALIYQVLWIKQLSLVVGVDVHAVATVISGFFAGLALGAAWIGRRVENSATPMRVFSVLEAGVAVLGVLLTLGLAHAAPAYARLEAQAGVVAMLLPFLVIALPAVLMGGTLPALMRAWRPQQQRVGAVGGGLYAANTAGAIVGALLVPFLLIPAFGVQGSALVAAAINLLMAGLAWGFARRLPSPAEPGVVAEAVAAAPAATAVNAKRGKTTVRDAASSATSSDAAAASPDAASARRAVRLYAIAGGIALGYEIIWSQAIVQFMSTRSFAFAVMLATYLAGLVIGSAIYARYADRARDPWGVFGLLVAGAGLLSLLLFAGLGSWLPFLQGEAAAAVRSLSDSPLAAMSARFAVAAVCIVLLPTLLLGAAFPAALRLVVNADRAGRDTGSVLALNTLGGIVGSLLVGFVLLPKLGLIHALGVLALCAAAVGVAAVLPGLQLRSLPRVATLAVAVLAVVSVAMTPADRLASMLAASRGGELAFYEESRGGTVAVVAQRSAGGNEFRRLYIQGVSNSGDAMTSQRYMRLQALLPLIVHGGEPRSALVIGLGTGITAGALLSYPDLERRVVAELLPAVLRAVPQFQGNNGVAGDSRMDIRLRDGRRELLASDERYDLVTLEPPPPSAAGVVNLYSRDFYRLAASRLNDKGIVAQWLPLPTQNDEDTRSLVRSFLDVFPHASLWTTELHEMLLVGSLQPLELDAARISARFARPEVAAALQAVGIASPAALLATWVTDRKGLERYAGDAAPVTDDRPRIEYAGWVRRNEIAEVLPRLIELETPVPLRGADEALTKAIERERDNLLIFYEAGLYAYAGDRTNWLQSLQYVMRRDGDNPYYQWVAGAPQKQTGEKQ
ncbi:fused MFS/spermidine synthase [Uliginosibacterium sp. H1]|uniref:fused MFS/spermidine synthase n=1 Tax=Uliginosibacterium sp. H1 TaxID=3114757 RepID=UPI002E18227F|nr:fused MFS/spermidine synthase [Uliginosibacterium sp. H1]